MFLQGALTHFVSLFRASEPQKIKFTSLLYVNLRVSFIKALQRKASYLGQGSPLEEHVRSIPLGRSDDRLGRIQSHCLNTLLKTVFKWTS